MRPRNDLFVALAVEASDAVLAGDTTNALFAFEDARQDVSIWRLNQLDERIRPKMRNSQFVANRRALIPMQSTARRGPARAFRAIMANPKIALLFAHSYDGYIRERAVRAVPIADGDLAALALLLIRCNDWVVEVREVALARLRAVSPLLSLETLAGIALFAEDRMPGWQRGGLEALQILQALPQWQAARLYAFKTQRSGPLARQLRVALHHDTLDDALPELAIQARSSFVRSAATRVVLEGTTRWVVGTDWHWTDKQQNIRRKVAVWMSREVQLPAHEAQKVFVAAARDRAISVRKLAAEHLIRTAPDHDGAVLAMLEADSAPAIAERIDYLKRKLRGETLSFD